MHIPEKYHGLIIAIPAFFQVISATLVGLWIDKAPKRVFMMAAFFGFTISNLLMGPSNILHLPKNAALFFLGYALNGFA